MAGTPSWGGEGVEPAGPADEAGTEEEPERGQIEVAYLPSADEADDAEEETDLFEQEEHPRSVILADMDQGDAPEFLEALKAQGIGAKLGSTTEQSGVQIVIHEANLADAQAVLFDFTGDATFLDDIDSDDELVPVSSAKPVDLSAQAERLATAGIDVRMEIPAPGDERTEGILWVAREDAEDARRELGITI